MSLQQINKLIEILRLIQQSRILDYWEEKELLNLERTRNEMLDKSINGKGVLYI